MRKLTIEHCHKLAAAKGGRCLSTEYRNTQTKMLWECKFLHQWWACFGNMKTQNQWCPDCSGKKRKTIEDCQKLAEVHGGRCLSTEYIDAFTYYVWECKIKHTWKAIYNNVQQGHWCPECAFLCINDDKKLTIQHCYQLAESMGGKCLSTEYINANTKYLWECALFHQWRAQYSSIKCGKWCPECGGTKRLTIEECQILAEKMGGKCLSTEYKNNRTKLLWECAEKHQWWSKCLHIKQGKWCPECSSGKSQKKLKNIICIIFPCYKINYNFNQFEWLKKSKYSSMELDFYIPDLKLAIEYDGEQHFKPIEYFGGLTHFHKNKRRDFLKNKLIYQNKQDIKTFIRIPYWEKLTEENIRNILKRNNVLDF